MWVGSVLCVPSCARFSEDVCARDALHREPGVSAETARAFELCGSLLQSLLWLEPPVGVGSPLRFAPAEW